MARLEFFDAAGQPTSIIVGATRRRITIGRNPESDISTTNASVSRNHGEIVFRAGLFMLQDLDSSNGTMLNGQELRPHKWMVLQDADVVSCGEFIINFFENDGPPVVAAPPPEPAPRPRVRPPAPEVVPEVPQVDPLLQPGSIDMTYDGSGPQPRLRPRKTIPEDGPVSLQDQVAPPPLLAPSDPIELTNLRQQVADLQRQVQFYQAQANAGAAGDAERQKLFAQLEERSQAVEIAQANLADQNEKIQELEAKIRRQELEVQNHLDKQLEMRGQIAHQAAQVTDLRKELNLRDHQVEELQFKVDETRQKEQQLAANQSGRDKEINNLKAELTTKSRMIDELQKQVNITSYDLQQAMEHITQLQEKYSHDGGEVDLLKRKIADLKQVMDDKDQQIADKDEELANALEELEILREDDRGGTSKKLTEMRAEADRFRQENEALRHELQGIQEELERVQREAAASGGSGPAKDQLNQLKRDNRDLRRQIEDLEAQLTSASSGGGKGGGADPAQLEALQIQVDDLQDENRLLQERIAKMRGRSASDPEAEAAKAENQKLRQQIGELEGQLADAQRRLAVPPPKPGLSPESVESLKQVRGRFGDLTGTMNLVVDKGGVAASELKRLVELLERVDLSGLNERHRNRLEMMLRDVRPKDRLDELEEAINSSAELAKGAQQDLDRMRQLLEV